MNVTTTTEKVLNACWRLNADAYQKQILARWKPIKQFIPCSKAVALMLVISEGKHFGTCNKIASNTQCDCHPAMTFNDLVNYELDPSYRIAAENGDRKTLYPKFYGGPK